MDDSSFSILPSELIEKIFSECLPDITSFKACDAPLLLTHVCHTWRSIAEDNPRLWSHIAIPCWTKCPSNVYELTRLWVSRTSNAPLDIDILLYNEDAQALASSKEAENLDDLTNRLLALLVPHRSQIQSLWGVFPTSCLPLVGVREMENMKRLFYYGSPKYDDLLRVAENFNTEDAETRLDLGHSKENLKILSISDCSVDINAILLQAQLTHLELFDLHRSTLMCQETAFKILQSLPNLQKCIFELFKNERIAWNRQGDRLALGKLELLFLIWIFPADITILLDSISAPNLIRLGIRGTPTVGMWNGLYDFLQSSQPPLLRLTLGNLEDVDIRLLDCLRCCPLLTHLSISHSLLPERLFPSLTLKGEEWDMELLPRLEIFTVEFCAGLKAKTVAACLASRAQDEPAGFHRLQEVEIIECVHVTQNDVPILLQCGVQKLTLKIL
ncbi:hypothetical protein ACEPAF_9238 [Sanghuangporus sanghuang]